MRGGITITTKAYLQSIEELDKRIESKLVDKYQLETMATSITVSNDTERVQSSSEKDRMANTVAKIIDLEKEIDILVDSFIDRRRHIISQIDAMENPTYIQVLSLRYIGKRTLDDIAISLGNKSRRHADRVHGRALQEFERLYGEEYAEIL